MLRFLVFGASGLAGHLVTLYLTEQGYDVTGFDRRPTQRHHSITGDVTDQESVRQIIADGHYDTVINCIGILNQFAERDHAMAVYLNSYFPHFLASVTEGSTTQVIHMSTDCVFSGERGGYTEHDLRDGTSFYDRSKALGEIEDDKNVTFRNSIVGPDINPDGIGLFNWFMQQKGPVRGYAKAMWTGLTTLELAKAMESAALQRAHGLFNMVYSQSISKYHLLQLFNRYLRHDTIEITPSDDVALDKSLVRTNFDFDYTVPDYETMVAQMATWIGNHKDLYPHYPLTGHAVC